MGSFPRPGPIVSKYADVLVLCATELQPHPAGYHGVKVIGAPLRDDGTPITREEIHTAKRAARSVRKYLDTGHVVLVTCAMGLNRSGLVSAMALMLPPASDYALYLGKATPSCLTSDQAIRAVRRARTEWALRNAWFEQVLAMSDGVCGARPNAIRAGAFMP